MPMHVVVAYDIHSNKIRTRMFRLLSELGLHTQLSVFECDLEEAQCRDLLSKAEGLLDVEKGDSLLLYPLCRRCSRGADILGQGLRVVNVDWQIV